MPRDPLSDEPGERRRGGGARFGRDRGRGDRGDRSGWVELAIIGAQIAGELLGALISRVKKPKPAEDAGSSSTGLEAESREPNSKETPK